MLKVILVLTLLAAGASAAEGIAATQAGSEFTVTIKVDVADIDAAKGLPAAEKQYQKAQRALQAFAVGLAQARRSAAEIDAETVKLKAAIDAEAARMKALKPSGL